MRAAIVTAIHGQADLLGEAVASLLDQAGAQGHEVAIILVDDACPDPRTRRKAQIAAAAHPGRVFCWRAPRNRGLSAARNAGVRRALELWPDLDAVAFVDGDDKVFRGFVARGLALVAEHGGRATADGGRIGWIYEDWQQFNTPESLHAPAPFQPLFALAACQHTPGCFCVAQMFRDGLWFDETRRGGDAEDWQFWVNGYAHGWRGHHAESVGFRYRRRLGGLGFAGQQAAMRNRLLIQREFPALFRPAAYLARETGDAARYVQFRDTGGAVAGPGPGDDRAGTAIGMAQVADWMVRLRQLPTARAPAQALFFTGGAHDTLARAGLLDWSAWVLEAGRAAEPAVLSLSPGGGDATTVRADTAAPGPAMVLRVPLLELARRLLAGGTLAGIAGRADLRRLRLDPALPAGAPAPAQGPDLAAYQADLAAALARCDQPGHDWSTAPFWRPYGAERTQLDDVHLALSGLVSDHRAGGAALLVVAAEDLAHRPGALDLAALARHHARADGIRPSLCVLGARMPALQAGLFRSVFLVPALTPGLPPEGLCAAFGTLVSVDCPEAVPIFNAVRRFGAPTVAVLPDAPIAGSRLAAALPDAFKAFTALRVRRAGQGAHLAALGVAGEAVDTRLLDAASRG